MRKKLFYSVFFILFLSFRSFAQIEIAKLIGKNSDKYSIGFGASLNFGYQISTASSVSAEAGFLAFFVKENKSDGLALIPFKLGYRYTFGETGYGFFIQPQAGYNFFGANSYNGEWPYKGPVSAIGVGYLFETGDWLKPEISIRYESVWYEGGPASFIALRFAQSLMFGRKESDY